MCLPQPALNAVGWSSLLNIMNRRMILSLSLGKITPPMHFPGVHDDQTLTANNLELLSSDDVRDCHEGPRWLVDPPVNVQFLAS